MSGSRIVLRDPNSLAELQESLHFASDSIIKILAHFSDYCDSMIETMKEQKKMLEEQVEEAKERLSQAEEDYSSCLSSQTYDEEERSYRPSCDSESDDVDRCREQFDDLQDRNKQADSVLGECERELSKYRETGGPLTPPGGETLMRYVAKGHTDKANEKMDRIRECVSNYMSISCAISDAKLQRNAEQAQLYEEGVKALEEKKEAEENQTKKDKAEAFNDATISLQKRMSEIGYKEADAVAVCPRCKRPINVCICQHILERSR